MKQHKIFNKKNGFLLFGGTLLFFFLSYILYQSYVNKEAPFSLMTIPIIIGIVFENKRLSSSWEIILYTLIGAFLLSIVLSGSISSWPYWFIIFFVIISIFVHRDKVTQKLTEGITLLQSISIIYWVIDIGFFNYTSVFAYIVMTVILFFSGFSFFYAFTYIKLTHRAKLFLSIWSSLIMVVFAIAYIARVSNTIISNPNSILVNDYRNIVQYFLLGVSLIYIIHNGFLVFGYFLLIKEKGKENTNEEVHIVSKIHINRYSDKQVNIFDSVFALVFTVSIYYFNHLYQITHRSTIIWFVCWVFPFVIMFKNRILSR